MLITYIRVTIQLLSPWRVGAPGAERSRQHTLTDVRGCPVIPPSSLAGSFRAHLGVEADRLMGSLAEKAVASPVWFLGTRLTGAGDRGPRIERRTGTSISRARRAARIHGLHGIDEVYGAEEVRLYLRFDGDSAEILPLLASWRPSVGGGLTTGLGRARVAAIRYRTFDTGKRADIIARATIAAAGDRGLDSLLVDGQDHEVIGGEDSPALSAIICIDDLHLNGLTDNKEDRVEHQWFHGTRWKGMLRSRVEYIGRSLGLTVCGEDEQTWEGCGRCSVCETFGSADTGAGLWSFECTKLSNPRDAGKVRYRNAIDRFTGGVLDQRLFCEVTSSTAAARLVIGSRSELEPHHVWVAKALLLALKDLHDGYFGIGGRSTTGLGAVRIDSWEIGPGLRGVVADASSLQEFPRIDHADLAADKTAHVRQETADA